MPLSWRDRQANGPAPGVEVVLTRVPRFEAAHYQGPNNEVLPNSGLSQLAGVLHAAGISYRLLEPLVAHPGKRSFSDEIEALQPRIVGFTCCTQDVYNAIIAAATVKRIAPGAFVVLGGPHPSALPRQTMEEHEEFDAVVVGEGEQTLLELAQAVAAGGRLDQVRGLVYRENGEIVSNPPRELIDDLEQLPFPRFDQLPLTFYRQFYSWMTPPTVPVGASRGCPYRCNFCYHPFGNQVRTRSIASVIAEIQNGRRFFGARNVVFVDETFTLDAARTTELCRALLSNGLARKIGWLCNTRVDRVPPDLVRLMKEAGCRLISFGVESGNQEILHGIGKMIDLQQARAALRLCRETGVMTAASFQIGQPGETPATVRDTVSFAVSSGVDYAQFCILTPYPGTQIEALAREGKQGLVLLTDDWRKYDKTGGALELRNLSAARLARLQRLAYARFYLRPSRLRRVFEMATPSVFLRYLWWNLTQFLRRSRPGKPVPPTAA